MFFKKTLLMALLIAGSSATYAIDNSNTINDNIKTQEKKETATTTAVEAQDYSGRGRTPIVKSSFTRRKIYKTKYFEIHYDNNSIDATRELIRSADLIAEAELALLKMDKPSKRITVFVGDSRDDTNSYSTGYGIHLFTNNNRLVSPNLKEWIPYLFSHELQHELIDHKLRNNGINKYIPLSNNFVDREAVPRWWTEGMAVTCESMIAQGKGRTFSPVFMSQVKRDINEDKFKGVGSDLSAQHPYEYGDSFCKFYLETYGSEKYSEAIDYYSRHKFGGIGRSYAHVAGVDADTLHDQWMTYLKDLVRNGVKGDLVEGPAVLDNHAWHYSVVKDGNNLWAYNIEVDETASAEHGSDVRRFVFQKFVVDKDGNVNREESKDSYVPFTTNQIGIKGDNAYYSKTIKSSVNGTIDAKAYRYNLKTHKKTFLKTIKRSAGFANIGGTMYYIFNENGVQGISTLNNQTILPAGKYNIDYLTASTQNTIIASVSEVGKIGSKIIEVNPTTKEVKFLANGNHGYLDGNTLYYTNSYGEETGNIYKTELGSGKTTKVTNVLYDATDPLIVNGQLYYRNYSSNNYTLSHLKPTDFVNKTEDTATLEAEGKARDAKNLAFYGKYGKIYDPNTPEVVTNKELEDNQDKEIMGYYIPNFRAPRMSVGSNGVFLISTSTSGKDTLALGYSASSLYNNYQGTIQAGKDFPTYTIDKSKGHGKDLYFGTYIHQFAEPDMSNTTLQYSHMEVKQVREDSRISKAKELGVTLDSGLLDITLDIFKAQTPVRIDALDKSVYFGESIEGNLFGTKTDKFHSLTLEFGYDSHTTGMFNEANTVFGFVINSDRYNEGNYAHNYAYIDHNIKRDIPYVKELSYLNLRSRTYIAPNQMTQSTGSLAGLTKGDNVSFNNLGSFAGTPMGHINNAKLAETIYGNTHYDYRLDLSSDFGMVNLSGVVFNLGYDYTIYKDEKYSEGSALNFNDISITAYQEAQKKSKVYEGSHPKELAILKKANTPNEAYKEIEQKYGKTEMENAKNYVKDLTSANKKLAAQTNKLQNAKVNQSSKSTIIRQGFIVNPSVTAYGTLFNDVAAYNVQLGYIYTGDVLEKKLYDNDMSYISFGINF